MQAILKTGREKLATLIRITRKEVLPPREDVLFRYGILRVRAVTLNEARFEPAVAEAVKEGAESFAAAQSLALRSSARA